VTDRQPEADRPLFPRWSPIGIGIGNVAIALVVHAVTGSRAAAITFAAILIASVPLYAAHIRARGRAAALARPAQSVAPMHNAPASEPEDDFVVVRHQGRQ
jgi:hypothetical protein